MKKIAHIVRRFAQAEWGGTETVVYNLCRQLEKQGIDSPIFSTAMLSEPGVEILDGLKIRRFSYQFPWIGLQPEDRQQMALKGGNPLSISLLWGLLREKNLSTIHLHVQHRLGGIGRLVARLRGIPYVVTLHGGHFTLSSQEAQNMQAPFRGKWEWGKIFGALLGSRRVLQDAAAIVCVGKDEYEAMCRHHPTKRVEYIPNGVDLSLFETASPQLFRERYQIPEKEKIILCVSRFDPQKNQKLLIETFIRFSKENREYRLVLIGPVTVPAYYQEIQHLAEGQNILIIPGLKPTDPLLPSSYRAADLFVLPSQMEPFGMVILEAWAAKTPVIASKVGGIPGFTKNEENVLHFPSQDGEELLSKVKRLTGDPTLCDTLGDGGHQEVQQYSWEALVKQYSKLYQEIKG